MSATTDSYLDHMDEQQAEEPTTLTEFIYKAIKDKDQAHEVDQKIRNLVTPYLSDKEELRNALYGNK